MTSIGEHARTAIEDQGVRWDNARTRNRSRLKPVDLHETRDRVLDVAAEAEPTFRALAGSTSAYDVTIECTTWTTIGPNGWTAQVTTSEHYQQLVRAELHGMINEGRPVAECATHARRRIPWWTSNDIANELTDRSTDPLLRFYLWTYPAGIDWFVALVDTADETTIGGVLRGTFDRPLSPTDLAALWPSGPAISGLGS